MERTRFRVPRAPVTLPLQGLATTARFTLERRDRLDGVGAANRFHACLRKPEVLDLALLNQVLHRPCHILDWHVRVDTVLIEEINPIGLESLQGRLGHFLNVLRPTIQPALPAGFEREPELGGDHHLITVRGESFLYKLFIGEWAISFGGVEERHAAVDGRTNQRDHFRLVRRRTVAEAHAHTAEPQR
jgi:hypothetical protein